MKGDKTYEVSFSRGPFQIPASIEIKSDLTPDKLPMKSIKEIIERKQGHPVRIVSVKEVPPKK